MTVDNRTSKSYTAITNSNKHKIIPPYEKITIYDVSYFTGSSGEKINYLDDQFIGSVTTEKGSSFHIEHPSQTSTSVTILW